MAGEGQSRSDQETVDNLKGIVKSLRKRLTDAEKVLWKHLRAKQLQGLIKGPIFVLTRISPLTPTLSPNPGGEGRVRGIDPSILFRDD